ncbi:NUDIX domain-containing protein, partial [candidate division FCPU426 bacterium]|nr:NUDIX domain-containing protein [candidate division FCPU426 bacterium]
LMELGATICGPRTPNCVVCPLAEFCWACARDLAVKLPCRSRRRQVPHRRMVVAAIYRQGKFLLGKRPPQGLLGGLWDFPGGQVYGRETGAEAVRREVRRELGVAVRVGGSSRPVRHAYTHFTQTLTAYACRLRPGSKPGPLFHTALHWLAPGKISAYPLPAATRKLLRLNSAFFRLP